MMERTPHEPPLHLRRFVAEDFATYRHWYADALLDQHLGPMDDEWLAHVLTDTEGEQWAALAGEALVAVVGLSLDPEHEAWVISDLAVDPARRGQGWGRKALLGLLALPAMQQRPNWRAYVADDNPGAQAFFDALGWQRLLAPSADDPFWTFGWRRPQ
ncbi:GNAT family N-acetyltransferase [uncultured Pigmentiphaga sp.]|jgi:Acetyltransferases|uniref:GNAT family N-acetyltransferase n=1 Tax=uncultured Pigmentiphaga sp. TaxID=340361 RepID=UPI002620B05D|nr:GNAT family N-acetyltransferase [uncultured Pigmentiphaga sp.]